MENMRQICSRVIANSLTKRRVFKSVQSRRHFFVSRGTFFTLSMTKSRIEMQAASSKMKETEIYFMLCSIKLICHGNALAFSSF